MIFQYLKQASIMIYFIEELRIFKIALSNYMRFYLLIYLF